MIPASWPMFPVAAAPVPKTTVFHPVGYNSRTAHWGLLRALASADGLPRFHKCRSRHGVTLMMLPGGSMERFTPLFQLTFCQVP